MADLYLMLGFFWRDGRPYSNQIYPFTAEIIINADGSFRGMSEDGYGEAEISGNIREGILKFTKKYLEGCKKRVANILLEYTLQRSAPEIFAGGWLGEYKIIAGETLDVEPAKGQGQAACSLHRCHEIMVH